MQLIDTTLAFVLTLAALATVVTVILEACLRIARMRKKNLVEVMKSLDEELAGSMLDMSPDERWEFFIRVVQNRGNDAIERLNPELKNIKNVKVRMAYLGRERGNHEGRFTGRFIRLLLFIRQLIGDKKRTGLNTKVSLEHMLHCLAESEAVKKATAIASDAVHAEFNRIARKFEEFGASVSAGFKQYSQAWSIVIGITLAVCANVNGVRILEAYRISPELAAIVIDRKDTLETNYEEAKTKQQIADLISLGIPMGWQCYPSCPFGGDAAAWATSCPECRAIPVDKREIGTGQRCLPLRVAKTLRHDFFGFALWLMVVVGTGVLIGLGAPFWFDVAKRLAQIRKGVQSPSASSEYRLSGSDANGDYEKRKEIVTNVLTAAAAEEAARSAARGARRAFSDGKGEDDDRGT
jgi:hypothetical protein